MRRHRIALWAGILIVAGGCSTYRVQKGTEPYEAGYVVTRDNFLIPEYTLGAGDSVAADPQLAQERFQRRRKTVENYYTQMGYIESRFKEIFVDNITGFGKAAVGVFKLPFIAVSDYRYRKSPAYRQRIDARHQQDDAREEARVAKLREQLDGYIRQDILQEQQDFVKSETQRPVSQAQDWEEPVQEAAASPAREVPPAEVKAPSAPSAPGSLKAQAKQKKRAEQQALRQAREAEKQARREAAKQEREEKRLRAGDAAAARKEARASKGIARAAAAPKAGQVRAAIRAKPLKGSSPLKVVFSAAGSRSSVARISAYEWDFGDGDTAKGRTVTNTFWSTTYGSRLFSVTLTVYDSAGNQASETVQIEVIGK